MADVKFEVARVALDGTLNNTTDITISGFGTPKAAIFISNEAGTDDAITSDLRVSFGFTDGTNQAVQSMFSNDGQGTSDNHRAQRTDAVVVRYNGSDFFGIWSFSSFITDGVRVTCDDESANRLCTVILIGGSDVSNAHVGTKDDLGNSTATVDINTVGFEPDLVFLATSGNASPPPNRTANNIYGLGIAHNDGLDTQRASLFASQDGNATTNVNGYISNNETIGQVFNGSVSWLGTVGSFDADGFSITPSSGTGNDIVSHLSLKFTNSPDIALFDMQWPTTGDYAETSPGFEPSFGFISNIVGVGTRNSAATAGGFGYSLAAFDASSIFTTSSVDEDGASTSVAKSLSADRLRILDSDGSTDSVIASGYAFDADGWDFTLTTNPGSIVLGWGLAVGPGDAGVASLVADQGSFTLTGQAAGLTASRLLTANQGSYTLTGQDATLAFTKVLEAAQGSYSLSGQPAGLLASRTLTADQGSYTLSGQDAALTVTVTLDAEQGSYTFTGQDAGLITSRLLEANQGSYSLTGQDATLTFQAAAIDPLIAEQGSYSLTGQTADLVVSFKLDAVQGTYTLTGQDVDLIAQLVGDATGAVTRKVFPERLTAKANDTTTAKVH